MGQDWPQTLRSFVGVGGQWWRCRALIDRSERPDRRCPTDYPVVDPSIALPPRPDGLAVDKPIESQE